MFLMKKYFSKKAIVTSVVLLLLAVISTTFVLQIKDVFAASDSEDRLVTIYDRDSQKSIVTNALTVKDALKQAGIKLDDNDIVEPARDEVLVAPSYRVNVYRARPVTVVDGNTRQKIMTPYQTARQIAQSAGITVYPEDITDLRLSTNILADGAGLEMVIKRAKVINVNLFGKNLVLRTQGNQVSDFLKEKSITLGDQDRISVDKNSAIVEGMSFRIWREGKQTISEEQPINFEVERIKDADKLIGYKAIRTPGVLGTKNVTYEIEIQNGQEVSRREIASVVLVPASKQVEVIGSKVSYVPYSGSGQKTDWMRMAGIPESDWGYVDFIIQKESGWNPNSINRNSGACGLAQALPCSKVPGNPLDPVDNLKWANGYAQTCTSYRKYCGWAGAYDFWISHRWW